MKILQLAPPDRRARTISRYSFIDEEISSLAKQRNVSMFFISSFIENVLEKEQIKIVPVGNESILRKIFMLSAFMSGVLNGMPVRSATDIKFYYYIRRIENSIARIVENNSLDLVHSHFGFPGGAGGGLAKNLTKKPLVATFRGADINTVKDIEYGARNKPIFDFFINKLISNADVLICSSKFMEDRLISLGADRRKIFKIFKGVDTEKFKPAKNKNDLKERLGINNKMIILCVASLKPVKGLENLLNAFSIIKACDDRVLIVCGDGYQRNDLEKKAKKLGLKKQVRFLGKIDRNNIPYYFKIADVFVLSSLVDAAPNVILEAMSSGLPIVTTDCGGPTDYVEDGVNGFVVPINNYEQLGHKIDILLKNKMLREKIGKINRETAQKKYKYDYMVQHILRIYEKLIYPNYYS